MVFEQLDVTSGDRILEVGFGGGDLLERILLTAQAERVAGVDHSADMVEFASKRFRSYIREHKLEVRCGDIEALLYDDQEFTKLCSVNTIYFWRNAEAAVAECRRVLRPGGRILICLNSKKDMEAWPIHQHGFRLYELDEVKALLGNAGFSNIEVTSANDAKQGLFHCVSGTAV